MIYAGLERLDVIGHIYSRGRGKELQGQKDLLFDKLHFSKRTAVVDFNVDTSKTH